VIYHKAEAAPVVDNGRHCGIDVGLNNLFAVAFNSGEEPLLVNGRPLKSINQLYNKKRAQMQSELNFYVNKEGERKQRKHSKRLDRLTTKRNNKINDYVHKCTHKLVNTLKQSNVSKVIIGKNDGWKDEIRIGKKNNQNFVSLPHARIIEVLKYKLEFVGIEVILREESYTSKASLLNLDRIPTHRHKVPEGGFVFSGYREHRGLYKIKGQKTRINADINGAGNILRKEIPNAFANGIEGLVVSPRMLLVST
jgi:IS605 OrfB family transposase